jgi:hypothetical protein
MDMIEADTLTLNTSNYGGHCYVFGVKCCERAEVPVSLLVKRRDMAGKVGVFFRRPTGQDAKAAGLLPAGSIHKKIAATIIERFCSPIIEAQSSGHLSYYNRGPLLKYYQPEDVIARFGFSDQGVKHPRFNKRASRMNEEFFMAKKALRKMKSDRVKVSVRSSKLINYEKVGVTCS